MNLRYNPKALIVDQTVKCNQACFFCWRADRAKVSEAVKAAPWMVMPIDMYRRIIDEASRYESLVNLSLCGPMGEPTLVPDLAERGAYALRKEFRSAIINTNGYRLHDHDSKDLLKGFTSLQVSLDAVDPDVHQAVHGKAGQLDQILANIDALVEAKRKHGGAQIVVRVTEADRNEGQWPKVRERLKHVDRFIHRRVHAFVDVVARGSRSGALACNQPKGSVNYTYTGHLTTCCINYQMAPVFGHIDEGSLKDQWEGADFEDWRESRMQGLCKSCSGLGAQSQAL